MVVAVEENATDEVAVGETCVREGKNRDVRCGTSTRTVPRTGRSVPHPSCSSR